MSQIANSINEIEFKSTNTQVFSSDGTYTPTTGMKYCVVEIVGGGGGGAGTQNTTASPYGDCGGGGGGGAYRRGTFSAAEIGASQAVTIGNGGGSGLGAATGGTGGTTSFGALMSAQGGSGGQNAIASLNFIGFGGGGGFFGSGGQVLISGGSGGIGSYSDAALGSQNPCVVSGYGAPAATYSCVTPGGTTSALDTSISGLPGHQYGGGGAGARSNSSSLQVQGGQGASGVCVITEFL